MSKSVETLVKDPALVAKRHTEICEAALKLFSKKGFHRTSVREIAKASGLPIGTLYSYIKTKEDIFYLIYNRILTSFQERMIQAINGIEDPEQQFVAALEETLKIYDEYRDEVLLLYQESHVLGREALQSLMEVDRRYVAFFREILERGTKEGRFAVQDPHLIAVSILFLCAVWALKRWNLKGYGLEEVIGPLSRFILYGIKGPGRRSVA
ncbi:MAG: TetR/AcrR family transcriptional regulator [Candidatus Methylomirabilales bacterium]